MLKHGLVAATVLLSGCIGYGSPGPTTHERRHVQLDAAELTRIRLRMGAGELDVQGGATTLLDGDFAYNVPEWKPSIDHSIRGSISDLEVSQGDGSTRFGDTENRWRLTLNDAQRSDLKAMIEAFDLVMLVYACRLVEGEPRAVEVADLAWAKPGELPRWDILPADRPLVDRLVSEGPP